jgi:hypothetical protein
LRELSSRDKHILCSCVPHKTRKQLPRQRLSLRGAAGDEAISSGVGTAAPRLRRFAPMTGLVSCLCGWATPVVD